MWLLLVVAVQFGWVTGSVGGYVARVDRVPGAGEPLFPASGARVGSTAAAVRRCPGLRRVRSSARVPGAAIAPATGSPAGVKLLVSTMDERLACHPGASRIAFSAPTGTSSKPTLRTSATTPATATKSVVGQHQNSTSWLPSDNL